MWTLNAAIPTDIVNLEFIGCNCLSKGIWTGETSPFPGIEVAQLVESVHARLHYAKIAPDVIQAMQGLEDCMYKGGRKAGLERPLLHLVKLRASQINGCAWCIDMHTKQARAEGETEQRLYLFSAWRESPFFTKRERAALEWTESVTLVTQGYVPDDVYEQVRQHFSEEEMVYLTLAVVAINAWNRFNVSFRTVAGDYRAQERH
jgi:AhpD family alkylhydroperoxidase